MSLFSRKEGDVTLFWGRKNQYTKLKISEQEKLKTQAGKNTPRQNKKESLLWKESKT